MDRERPAEEAGKVRKEKRATIREMVPDIRAPVCRNCPFRTYGQASEMTRLLSQAPLGGGGRNL